MIQERVLSYTEVSTALTCEAQWDFKYGDKLAGSSLNSKRLAPVLGLGRAWGAGMAAWHEIHGPHQLTIEDEVLAPEVAAESAILTSLHRDMTEGGLAADDAIAGHVQTLLTGLELYAAHTTPLVPFDRAEHKIVVPLPSRGGKRNSNRYRFEARVDGVNETSQGVWLAEFKYRGRLTPVRLIARGRQPRHYAWAWREKYERDVLGIYVDETLRVPVLPPRLVKGKRKADGLVPSHAKDQHTTARWYQAVCAEHGVDPDPDTFTALAQRVWTQRVPIIFRRGELDEAGRELVQAAKKVSDLDHGAPPLRNVGRSTCDFCDFDVICDNPRNALDVEQHFTREPPKRDRPQLAHNAPPADTGQQPEGAAAA
jgi:hypothetical protein